MDRTLRATADREQSMAKLVGPAVVEPRTVKHERRGPAQPAGAGSRAAVKAPGDYLEGRRPGRQVPRRETVRPVMAGLGMSGGHRPPVSAAPLVAVRVGAISSVAKATIEDHLHLRVGAERMAQLLAPVRQASRYDDEERPLPLHLRALLRENSELTRTGEIPANFSFSGNDSGSLLYKYLRDKPKTCIQEDLSRTPSSSGSAAATRSAHWATMVVPWSPSPPCPVRAGTTWGLQPSRLRSRTLPVPFTVSSSIAVIGC